MGRLIGGEAHAAIGDRRVGAVEGHRLAGPEALHELERLLELLDAVLAREPDGLELRLAVADGHADVEPPVADVVEGGDILGDLHGIQHGQEQHRGLEPHRSGLGGQAGEDREGLRPHRRVRDEVLADGHPRKAHAGRGAHHGDGLVDDARGAAVRGTPERRQVKADLHGDSGADDDKGPSASLERAAAPLNVRQVRLGGRGPLRLASGPFSSPGLRFPCH